MVLDESDHFWREIRHKHIAVASPYVVDEFNKFVAEHKGMASGKKGAQDMKQMGEMMKQLPEYMDLMTKFSSHMELITQCFSKMKELKLDEFAAGEQIMSTGVDNDGKEIKKAFPYVTSTIGNITYPLEQRLREVLIYLLSQEYSEDDKKALIGSLRGDDDIRKTIDAALVLPKTTRERQKGKKGGDGEQEFDLSRYVPYIKEIVMRMANNDVPEYCALSKLDFAGFPVSIEAKQGNITVSATKSLKKQKAKATSDTGKLGTTKQEEVGESALVGAGSNILVIFITGAISYSEMRVAYELSEKLKMNVFIGSNCITTQNNFVKLIKSIGNESLQDISGELQ